MKLDYSVIVENKLYTFQSQHIFAVIMYLNILDVKVDREDHFWRSGFLHIMICFFLGYIASNFVKNIGWYRCLKTRKFEVFDRKSRTRPI